MQIQQNQLEINRKTVNKQIGICINCGSIAVKIENYGVFCKDCGSFFDVEHKKWWMNIHVEIFVDIMIYTLNLEIQRIAYLKNTVQFVIWNWFQDIPNVLVVITHLGVVYHNGILL